MSKNVPGLLSEAPIVVYPNLAVKIGINAACIFQQLHFCLTNTKNKNNTYNYVEGEWWVYNSYKQWREDHFPWLSERTIQNVFLELEKQGVVKSMQGVKSKADRRKWYTIDYEAWYTFYGTETDHDEKNVPSDDEKNVQSESETTSETTKEIASEDAIPNAQYEKPLRPGNVSDKQYDSLRPTYALGAALDKVVSDVDIPDYRKVANKLLAAGIPMDDFFNYVSAIRNLAQRQRGWDVTLHSITANGRITDYLNGNIKPEPEKPAYDPRKDPNVMQPYVPPGGYSF